MRGGAKHVQDCRQYPAEYTRMKDLAACAMLAPLLSAVLTPLLAHPAMIMAANGHH